MSLHYYTRGTIFHFDENLVGFFTPKVPSSLSNLSKCKANVTVAAKANKVWSQKAYMYFGCHFNVPYFDKACPPQWEQGILTLHYFRFLKKCCNVKQCNVNHCLIFEFSWNKIVQCEEYIGSKNSVMQNIFRPIWE